MKKQQKKQKKTQKNHQKPASTVDKAGGDVVNIIKRPPMGALIAIVCFLLVIGVIAGIAMMAGNDWGSAAETNFVDLTVLSSTMVYGKVNDMMIFPNDYIGKTIKMSGLYSASLYYPDQSDFYHFVLIEDAAACCQQGLEFIWKGKHIYPDDYPAENTNIEVVGVFGRYEDEFGGIHYYVAADDIVVLN